MAVFATGLVARHGVLIISPYLVTRRTAMASTSVLQFIDLLKQDKDLQGQVQKEMLSADSTEAALSAAAAIASAKGIELSGEDLKADLPKIAVPLVTDELTENELRAVSGGRFWNWAKRCIGSDTFACYLCAMGTSGA
jgi:predicted ribosomally synthesized peptide with nif11-like leader